jgi:Listeria-Bacteroides repeat domain (List_Bact_rpt).
MICAQGESFQLPEQIPFLEGADFLGWSTDKNAEAPTYQPGESVSFTNYKTTLYAVWDAFRVYYADPNQSPKEQVTSNGDEFTVIERIPQKTYKYALNSDHPDAQYTFLYWSDGVTDTEYYPGITYPISEHLTLTPVFEETEDSFIAMPVQVYYHYSTLISYDKYQRILAEYQAAMPPLNSAYLQKGTLYLVAKDNGLTADELGWIREDGSYPGFTGSIMGLRVDGEPLAKNTVIDSTYNEKTAEFIFPDPDDLYVRYHANGGSGAPDSWYGAPNSEIALSDVIPVWYGFRFNGWATDPDAEAASYQPGDAITVTQSMDLYALWEPVTATLNLQSNDSSGQSTLASGQVGEYVVPDTPQPREGFIFKGWAKSPESKIAEYLPGEPIALEEDMVLYAVWDRRSYTLALNSNDESNLRMTADYRYDSEVTLRTIYEHEDEYLLGWSSSPDTLEVDYPAESVIQVTANLELYAVWGAPKFILPEYLETIDDEAFEGCAFFFVQIPAQVSYIGFHAFAGCRNLAYICIPNAETHIDPDAFGGKENLIILGKENSTAKTFAVQNNYPFIPIK